MPLSVRLISMRIAVAFLFIVSFVSWFSGLEPLTCCKRALTAAVVAYIGSTIVLRIVNSILIHAFVKSRMDQQKEDVSEHGR